jgi:hypothetical protein
LVVADPDSAAARQIARLAETVIREVKRKEKTSEEAGEQHGLAQLSVRIGRYA